MKLVTRNRGVESFFEHAVDFENKLDFNADHRYITGNFRCLMFKFAFFLNISNDRRSKR